MSDTKAQHAVKGATQCVGRFDLALPAEFVRVGGEQRLYLVRVWSEAVAAASNPAQLWTSRVAGLREPAHPGGTSRLIREFTLQGLGEAAWYRPLEAHREDLRLLAMKPLERGALFLEVNAIQGRETVAEQVMTRLATSFATGSEDGFCVQHGAFVIAPSKNERASATFSGGGVEIRVETETVAVPDSGTGGSVEGMRMLLKRSRKVGGMSGIEERARVAHQDGSPELVYAWRYAGLAADGLNPKVHLSASAPEDRRALLDTAWTIALDSLRRRSTQ